MEVWEIALQPREDVLLSCKVSCKCWKELSSCADTLFLGMSQPRVVATERKKVMSLMQRLVAAAPIRRYHVERGGQHPSDEAERGRDIVREEFRTT